MMAGAQGNGVSSINGSAAVSGVGQVVSSSSTLPNHSALAAAAAAAVAAAEARLNIQRPLGTNAANNSPVVVGRKATSGHLQQRILASSPRKLPVQGQHAVGKHRMVVAPSTPEVITIQPVSTAVFAAAAAAANHRVVRRNNGADDEAMEAEEEDDEDVEDEDDDDGLEDDDIDDDDDDDDDDDEGGGTFMEVDITSQLASAGPTGIAAAAAISSTKKRRRSHAFETNPTVRKRQQTRLLRKLRLNVEEYSLRIGQQAVVLIATPGAGGGGGVGGDGSGPVGLSAGCCPGKSSQNGFRVFGAKPLEDVVKNLRAAIVNDLEVALAQQAPPQTFHDPNRHELPPLVIDGIPTPVEKMTQAQLRAFIPLMLKYSTGRGKPGWGKDTTRPPWWPKGVPWANVRMDARKFDEKQKVSWTQALREIVTNCYEFHGRQDLMPIFACDSSDLAARRISSNSTASASHNSEVSSNFKSEGVVEEPREITVQGQRLQLTPVVSAAHSQVVGLATTVGGTQMQHHQQQQHPHTLHQYAQVVQAVTNPDGTMSIIQVDSPSSIISLPDGTTAHLAHIDNSGHHGVSTLAEVATATAEQQQQGQHHTIEINGAEELQGPEGGHFLLAGEDGQAYPVSGVITLPVSPSVYQAVLQGQAISVNSMDGSGGDGHPQTVQILGTPVGIPHHVVKLDSDVIKFDPDEPTTAISQSSLASRLVVTSAAPSAISMGPSSNGIIVNSGIVQSTPSTSTAGSSTLTITPVAPLGNRGTIPAVQMANAKYPRSVTVAKESAASLKSGDGLAVPIRVVPSSSATPSSVSSSTTVIRTLRPATAMTSSARAQLSLPNHQQPPPDTTENLG